MLKTVAIYVKKPVHIFSKHPNLNLNSQAFSVRCPEMKTLLQHGALNTVSDIDYDI